MGSGDTALVCVKSSGSVKDMHLVGSLGALGDEEGDAGGVEHLMAALADCSGVSVCSISFSILLFLLNVVPMLLVIRS